MAILAHLEARRDHVNAHLIQSQSMEGLIIALEAIQTLVIALQTLFQVMKNQKQDSIYVVNFILYKTFMSYFVQATNIITACRNNVGSFEKWCLGSDCRCYKFTLGGSRTWGAARAECQNDRTSWETNQL